MHWISGMRTWFIRSSWTMLCFCSIFRAVFTCFSFESYFCAHDTGNDCSSPPQWFFDSFVDPELPSESKDVKTETNAMHHLWAVAGISALERKADPVFPVAVTRRLSSNSTARTRSRRRQRPRCLSSVPEWFLHIFPCSLGYSGGFLILKHLFTASKCLSLSQFPESLTN